MLKAALDSSITFFRKIINKATWLLTAFSSLPFLLELINEKYRMYEDTVRLSYPYLNYFLPVPDWLIVMSFIVAAPCWLISLIYGMDKLGILK